MRSPRGFSTCAAVHHDGVVEAAARASPAARRPLDLVSQGEGAGARELGAEASPASAAGVSACRPIAGASKSIDRASSSPDWPACAGRNSAKASPCSTRTGRSTSIGRAGASCVDRCRRSRAGTGRARRSRPAPAVPARRPRRWRCRCRTRRAPPSRCSTVPTRASGRSAQRRGPCRAACRTTWSKRAGMSTPRSVRRKTMPVSAGGGMQAEVDPRGPVCRPVPTQPIGAFRRPLTGLRGVQDEGIGQSVHAHRVSHWMGTRATIAIYVPLRHRRQSRIVAGYFALELAESTKCCQGCTSPNCDF